VKTQVMALKLHEEMTSISHSLHCEYAKKNAVIHREEFILLTHTLGVLAFRFAGIVDKMFIV
jgi:hypothetical protein